MSEGPMILFSNEKATISTATGADGMPAIRFDGMIDAANPGEFLDPAFARFHQHAIEVGAGKVLADLSGLTFLNSSGIKSFAKWVLGLMADGRYTIVLRYARGVSWQQTSMKPIALLAKGRVELEPVER